MDSVMPAVVRLHHGQALDCYLEHVADANYITTAHLISHLRAATDTTRHLMLAPTDTTLRALSTLTGQPQTSLRDATLARYDGTALNLTGLDPLRPGSYRTVAARGWIPGHGTQICPACLGETGHWSIHWRVPTTTVCTIHGTYLLTTCPNCHRVFRDQRHSPLRIAGATTRCGNPLGRGPREQCQLDLADLEATTAGHDCLTREGRHDNATTGAACAVLGQSVPAGQYLTDVRALAVLLLHIATAAGTDSALPEWTRQVANRNPGRAPRWALKPPADTATRSRALTAADTILNATDVEAATTLLEPWLEAVPLTPDGRLGWLGDRTRMTPTLTSLLMAAHAPRRRLSRLLDTRPPLTSSPHQIPQVIPAELYDRHLAGLFTCRPETVRLFASLCIARTHPDVTRWGQAAETLGLAADLGERTARACSAGQLVTPQDLTTAIAAAAADLDQYDFRDLERRVRSLATRTRWFTRWTRTHRPGTRNSSHRHAIIWLWNHVSHAHLSAVPLPPPVDLVGARAFAASMTNAQARSLARSVPPH